MASTNVKTITDTNFSDEVLKSELPTLVDFWAVWCGPCKQIAPTIDALADEYKGKLAVGKVDVDREQIVAQQLRVTSIPALFLFKHGKVVWSFAGAAPRSKIEAEVKKHL
jgi:thioredoxin 1